MIVVLAHTSESGIVRPVLRVALLLTTALAALLFGSVYTGTQNFVLGLVFLIAFVFLRVEFLSGGGGTRRATPGGTRLVLFMAGLFVAYVVFQTVSLPWSRCVVGWLSPRAAQIRARAFGAGEAAGWFPLTVSLYHTRISLVVLCGCFAALFVGYRLFRGEGRGFVLANSIVLIGTVLSLQALFERAGGAGRGFGFWTSRLGGGPYGPFVNPNHFANYVGILLPLAAGVYLADKSRTSGFNILKARIVGRFVLWDFLMLCQIALILGALLASDSRGGILCASAGLILVLVMVVSKPSGRWSSKLAKLLLLGVVSVIVAYAAYVNVKNALAASDDWKSLWGRMELIAASLRLWRDFPLFGSGYGTFVVVFPAYQTTSMGQYFWEFAHCDWVQLLADVGVVGGVIAAAFAVCLLALFFRSRGAGGLDNVRIGCLGSLVALVAHATFSFPLHITAIRLLVMAILALLLVCCEPSAAPTLPRLATERLRRFMTRLSALLAMVACVPFVVQLWYNWRADAFAYPKDKLLPVAAMTRLAGTEPDNPDMHFKLAGGINRWLRTRPPERRGQDPALIALADTLYRRAIALDPAERMWHEAYAWFLLARSPKPGDAVHAEGAYQMLRAHQLAPTRASLALEIGRISFGLGQSERAEGYLRVAALNNAKLIPDVLAELVAAGADVRRIQRSFPLDAASWRTLGALYLRKADTGAAAAALKMSARISDPRNAAYQIALAGDLVRAGLIADAVELLRRAMARSPGDLSIPFALARIYEDAGRGEEAADLLARVREENPSSGRALATYATFLTRRKEFAKAEALLAAHAGGLPAKEQPEALLQLADLRVNLKKPDEAAGAALSAAAISGYADARVLARALRVLERTRQVEPAEDLFRKASAKRPDPRVLLAFAGFYQRQGKADTTLDLVRRAAAAANYADVRLICEGAAILNRAHKSDEAIDLIKSAMTKKPRTPELHQALATSYRSAGDILSAIDEMDTAMELQPKNKAYKQLRERYILDLRALRKLDGTVKRHGTVPRR